MGRVGTEGFEKDANYEGLVGKATLAEKTKMDAAINWYEANNWEDALKLAQEKCNKTEIEKGLFPENRFKGNFVSENNAMLAIARIANLSAEEKNQFISEFYTKSSFSQNIRDKIKEAFKDNPEEKLIKVLRNVHVSWDIDQSNKFQMWNDKKGKARNTEHQFDDLLLMQYGEDGATADKLFVDTILNDLQINIDENKLKECFINAQKNFLSEISKKYERDGKNFHEALVEYLQSGEYISICEKIAGEPLTTHATAIKEDPTRAKQSEKWNRLDEISIKELLSDNTVAESMAELIENQIRENGIDIDTLGKAQTYEDSSR